MSRTRLDSALDELVKQTKWSSLLAKGDGSIWEEVSELGGGDAQEADRNIAWLVRTHQDPQPVPSTTVFTQAAVFAGFVLQLARGLVAMTRCRPASGTSTRSAPRWRRRSRCCARGMRW